ncbi:MAG: hypothetical protein ACRBBJ_08020 [Rhodomicrobiaceae bacterium]
MADIFIIMDLDSAEDRRKFRENLLELGIEEVRYRLGAKKYSDEKSEIVRQWINDFESGSLVKDELYNVLASLEVLETRFNKGDSGTGCFLISEDQSKFEGLYLELRTLLEEVLGPQNLYLSKIIELYNEGTRGFIGGPSKYCLRSMCETIESALKQSQRRNKSHNTNAQRNETADLYIAQSIIEELRLAPINEWDFSRLIQMCIELNAAYVGGHYITVAMLVRGIMDHIPPIFSKKNFTEIANNYPGKSFKDSMKNMDNSMRKISDALLHSHIQKKEILPSSIRIDVRRELEVLLVEIVKIAHENK